MKTNEFIQTCLNATWIGQKIKLSEIILQIDELRKLHVRFQHQAEYFIVDPNSFEREEEKLKIRNTAEEIKQFAIEHNIQTNFEKFGSDHTSFRNKFKDTKQFVRYFYENVEITNLIVFVEKKVERKTKRQITKQTIAELHFDSDFSVLDENNVDINKIPGIDL